MSTTWSFSRRLAGGARFAVLAPDRILTSTYSDFRPFVTTKLVTFPSGKLVSKPKLPRGPIYRAADPNFVIVRPFAGYTREDLYNPKRSAAVEIRTGQVIVCDSPALDVFGQYYAAERTDGELGLYQRGKGLQATVTIPSH